MFCSCFEPCVCVYNNNVTAINVRSLLARVAPNKLDQHSMLNIEDSFDVYGPLYLAWPTCLQPIYSVSSEIVYN